MSGIKETQYVRINPEVQKRIDLQNQIYSIIHAIEGTSSQYNRKIASLPSDYKVGLEKEIGKMKNWMTTVADHSNKNIRTLSNDDLTRYQSDLQSLQKEGKSILKSINAGINRINEKNEREEKEKILLEISKSGNDINKMSNSVYQFLGSVMPGLKELYHDDIDDIYHWITKTEEFLQKKLPADLSQIKIRNQDIEKLRKEGEFKFSKVKDDILEKAPALEGKLREQFQELSMEIGERSYIFERWLEPDQISLMKTELNKIDVLFREKKLKEINNELIVLRFEFQKNDTKTSDLEEKNQRRAYVIDSLKKTCNSLGFVIVEEKTIGKGTLESHQVLVDTYDRGKIKFTFSLDTISADSAIRDEKCISEFDSISKKLEEVFGIETKFERKAGDSLPKEKESEKKPIPKNDRIIEVQKK